MPPVRLLIRPIIEQTLQLATRVTTELPAHQGLARATEQVAEAARKAERTAAAMKRPFSPHRLPVIFLAVALLALGAFLYWQFFYVSTLTLALPDRDAAALRERLARDPRMGVKLVDVPGSREAAQLLSAGQVDLGFIQGGVPVPPNLLRLETPGRELVLFFVRSPALRPTEVRQVLTSVEGEGSHSVAKAFFRAWGNEQVTFVHRWKELTGEAPFQLPPEVDAVFVVKDPADEKTLTGASRLVAQGFTLVPARLGARASRFDYLDPAIIPAGHLQLEPPIPAAPVETSSVSTWLVAREGLTPRRLTQAAAMLQEGPGTISERSFHLSSGEASELFQGLDSFLSIFVHLGVAFLALLGLDVFTYRKHLHELNSLVSLLSMLQSNKDLLGVREPAQRAEHQLYLSLCSDLLGLISAIAGYYTQENSSLLFNNLSEVVHQRCDSLKINIQLKLLHSLIR